MLTVLLTTWIVWLIGRVLRLEREIRWERLSAAGPQDPIEAATIAEVYARLYATPPSGPVVDTPVHRSPGPPRRSDAAPVQMSVVSIPLLNVAPGPPPLRLLARGITG